MDDDDVEKNTEDGNLESFADDNMEPQMQSRYDEPESYSKQEPGDDDYRPEEDVQLPGVDDLPLFASSEARKIDADIKQKELLIEDLSEKSADMAQRLKVMKNHFKNVQQELDHTNELSTAKVAEMQTEKHLQQLTSRAVGQNQAETKRLTLALEK